MPSVNERMADATVSHAVDLQQYSNTVVRRMLSLLNRVDADLSAALMTALERLPASEFTVDRLDSLLYSVRALNVQAYGVVERELTETLRQFAAYESGYQYELFTTTIPPQVVASVGVAQVEVAQVAAAAMARPFQGVLLREALAGQAADRARLIRDQIRIGYVAQETTGQIIRRLRGTKAKGYADGLLDKPRQHIEAIVRTAISHTAGTVRDSFYEKNLDLLKALQWCSTLDARTTLEFCVPRDGLLYTPDTHKPIDHKFKWGAGPGRLHWRCRSCSAPVVKSWKELTGSDLPDFTPQTRASMDGQVPAQQTYAQWLSKQSASRQDEVLGPKRAALFRAGEPIDKFFNDKGTFLDLETLRQRDAKMFETAGV